MRRLPVCLHAPVFYALCLSPVQSVALGYAERPVFGVGNNSARPSRLAPGIATLGARWHRFGCDWARDAIRGWPVRLYGLIPKGEVGVCCPRPSLPVLGLSLPIRLACHHRRCNVSQRGKRDWTCITGCCTCRQAGSRRRYLCKLAKQHHTGVCLRSGRLSSQTHFLPLPRAWLDARVPRSLSLIA